MKKLVLLLSVVTITQFAIAQTVATVQLKKTMTLRMPRSVDDDKPGTRGASVVWHPIQKKYYAAMAGNAAYPLGIYDEAGKKLSNDTVSCAADVRGLWFNTQEKALQGNGYDVFGWFQYKLDSKGLPEYSFVYKEGMNQPDAQSVGTYSWPTKEVLFLDKGYVSFYAMEDGTSNKTVKILWGQSKASEDEVLEETPADYNSTTVIFTGIKGAELGFLNTSKTQIELYNKTTGLLTKILALPTEAPMNDVFNFAYTNGMYWLFNIEKRTWYAYK